MLTNKHSCIKTKLANSLIQTSKYENNTTWENTLSLLITPSKFFGQYRWGKFLKMLFLLFNVLTGFWFCLICYHNSCFKPDILGNLVEKFKNDENLAKTPSKIFPTLPPFRTWRYCLWLPARTISLNAACSIVLLVMPGGGNPS